MLHEDMGIFVSPCHCMLNIKYNPWVHSKLPMIICWMTDWMDKMLFCPLQNKIQGIVLACFHLLWWARKDIWAGHKFNFSCFSQVVWEDFQSVKTPVITSRNQWFPAAILSDLLLLTLALWKWYRPQANARVLSVTAGFLLQASLNILRCHLTLNFYLKIIRLLNHRTIIHNWNSGSKRIGIWLLTLKNLSAVRHELQTTLQHHTSNLTVRAACIYKHMCVCM